MREKNNFGLIERETMPQLDIYVAAVPQNIEFKPVFPQSRQNEIEGCSNMAVKLQKYSVWQLLSFALKNSFGYDIEQLNIRKAENGQWVCDHCFFSLSHSKNAVAVAVSRYPVGVDIELISPLKSIGIEQKILSDVEKNEFTQTPENERNDYLLKKWTAKESEFKRKGERVFLPSKTVVTDDTKTVRVEWNSEEYYLSFTGQFVTNYKIYSDIFDVK